jgi:hypothetical protein
MGDESFKDPDRLDQEIDEALSLIEVEADLSRLFGVLGQVSLATEIDRHPDDEDRGGGTRVPRRPGPSLLSPGDAEVELPVEEKVFSFSGNNSSSNTIIK